MLVVVRLASSLSLPAARARRGIWMKGANHPSLPPFSLSLSLRRLPGTLRILPRSFPRPVQTVLSPPLAVLTRRDRLWIIIRNLLRAKILSPRLSAKREETVSPQSETPFNVVTLNGEHLTFLRSSL